VKSPENSQKLIKSRQLIFIRRENRFFDIFPNLQKRMIISWLSFLLLEVYGSRHPKNTIQFLDQGNIYDHRVKQERLRKLIIRQGDVISRTTRYQPSYLNTMEQIQKDIAELLEWRKTADLAVVQSEFEKKIAAQDARISRLIRSRRRGRRQRRHKRKSAEPSRRRRDVSARRLARRSENRALEHQVEDQGKKIRMLEEEIQNMKKVELQNQVLMNKIEELAETVAYNKEDVENIKTETAELFQANYYINETIQDLTNQSPQILLQNQTSEIENDGNYTLKWELQIMQSRLVDLEEKVNNTAPNVDDSLLNKLDVLEQQVIENTARNEETILNSAKIRRLSETQRLQQKSITRKIDKKLVNKKLGSLWPLKSKFTEQKTYFLRELANLKELVDNLDRKRQSEDRALPGLPRSAPTYSLTPDDPNDPREPPVTRSEIKSEIQAAFKDINETVADTTMVLDQMKDFQDQELAKLDTKLWDNEESILKLNSTIDHAINRIEDITSTVNGFTESLDNFGKLYKSIRDDVEIFMVNSTANMRAFDTTVDLSIDLLDRMGSFNEEIMERVSYMEDKYLDSLVSNDDYSSDNSKISDSSSSLTNDYNLPADLIA